MAQLILLVVAAAWLAVLIPPMLRSRVENRPNSSVTDFRRQLTTLQNTATPPRGAVRAIGRPLAQSPLQRHAAPGRPGQPMARPGVSRSTAPQSAGARSMTTTTRSMTSRHGDPSGEAPRLRSHGDPSGGHRRPSEARPAVARPGGTVRDRSAARPSPVADPTRGAKRRRSNVLFVLVVITACTLFLAATTSSTVMLYLFALSFLALCGYVYLLAQLRERESGGYDGWLENY